MDNQHTSWRWFATRVTALSKHSVWRMWAADQPIQVTGQAARDLMSRM